MPKKYKSMSRKHQRLIYALLKEYANHLASKSLNSLNQEFWLYKAKQDMKKLYIKATSDTSSEDPIADLKENINETLDNILDRDLKLETKKEIIMDDILCNLRYFIEDLSCQLGDVQTFSLTLKLCSSEKAIKFTQFLIDYFIDNNIKLSEKTRMMLLEAEGSKFTIACIRNRRCIITGKEEAEIHHIESYTSRKYNPEYAKDLLVVPVCREIHNLFHSKGNKFMLSEYHIVPVPEKLALGSYTREEIMREIEEHKNPKKHQDYKK